MIDPMIVNPRVNGIVYSWNSCSFTIDSGFPLIGIAEFNFEEKRPRKIVRGAKRSGVPLGKTSGNYEASGSMKLLVQTEDALTTYLTPKGMGSYGDADFIVTVQMFEPKLSSAPINVVCGGCTIDGSKSALAEGIDESVTEFELGMMWVIKNGKTLWSLSKDIP